MTESAIGAPPLVPVVVDGRSTTPAALLWRAMLHNAGEAVAATRSVAGGLLGAMAAPSRLLGDLPGAARVVRGFARELSAPRARRPLHAKRSLSRRLSTFTMSMTEIDAVGRETREVRLGSAHPRRAGVA